MRVLLTGAGGFLGKSLLPRLIRQYGNAEVTALYRRVHPGYDSLVSWCDLLDYNYTRDTIYNAHCDVVIHAAGSVGGIGANKKNPGRFIYENLQMGMNVINAAFENHVKKFILLGTVCSYPKHTPVPFNENDLWNGYPEETNAPYGIAKKTLSEMLRAYNRQYNFNSVCLMPANMYGPHDHYDPEDSHVIPALILKVHQAILRGDSSITLWGTGNATREFLYVDDCCDAIINAVDLINVQGIINVGTGQEISIRDLAVEICDQMGFAGRLEFDSSKPDGQPRRCLDTYRAELGLGFQAKTDLRTGLAHTIKWFKENYEHCILPQQTV